MSFPRWEQSSSAAPGGPRANETQGTPRSDDLKLTEYCVAHRNRKGGMENGTVFLHGKRVKKWYGYYHAVNPKTGKRITRKRAIGLKSEMTKAQAEDAHREWVRNFHKTPVADTPKATLRALAEDYYSITKGDWSEAWRATVRSMYDRVILPALGDRTLDSIMPEDLKNFINPLPEREWRGSPHFDRDKATIERVIVPGKTKKGIS